MKVFKSERDAIKDTLALVREKINQADIASVNLLISKLEARLDQSEVILDNISDASGDIADITERLKDAPDWVKALFEAGQSDAEKALLAIGHYGELAQKLISLIVLIRDGKHLHVKGGYINDIKLGGEAWLE